MPLNCGGGCGGQLSYPPAKDQTYGTGTHPVYCRRRRKSPSARRSRGGCCCSFCLCLAILLIGLVFLAAIPIGIIYFFHRPQGPAFEVAGVRLSAFSISGTGQLTSRFDLNLTTSNPNDEVTYLYDAASVAVLSGGVHVGDGTLPAFVDGAKSTTLLATTLSAGAQELNSTVAADMREKTTLLLEIIVDTKVGAKMGSLETMKMSIQVRCTGINIDLPNDEAAAGAGAGAGAGAAVSSPNAVCCSNAVCKVKPCIKVWKWTVS